MHLLSDVFPELANELRQRLIAVGEPALAESVARLRLIDRCRCGDDFCATFYTAPPPRGAYGPSHRNIDLDPDDGMIILDVVDEQIACVEVLYRNPVRRRLLELCP
jgi:hypothetical protein